MIGLSLHSWVQAKLTFISFKNDLESNNINQWPIKGVLKSTNGTVITNLSTCKTTQTDTVGTFEIAGFMDQSLKITMVGYHAQILKVESNEIQIMLSTADVSLANTKIPNFNYKFYFGFLIRFEVIQ